MKLQVNNRGAWKQITDFLEADLDHIKAAVSRIGEAAKRVDAHVTFRVLGDDDQVLLYWDALREWRKPGRAAS